MLSLKKLKTQRSKAGTIAKALLLVLIMLLLNHIVIADCADLDGDKVINVNDEAVIKEQWHQEVDCCNKIKCGDIDCDGFVDINDLVYWSKRTNTLTDCSDNYDLFVEVISSTSKVINTQLENSVFTIELENPVGISGVTNVRTNEKPTRARLSRW